MAGEDENPSGSDDVWTDEFDDAEPDDRFAEFFGARSEDPFDEGSFDEDDPSAKGSRGRLILGLGLLAVGLLVAFLAFRQSDDGGASSSADPEAKTSTTVGKASTTTTEAAPVTIVPTTLANGVLPTGCGDWDPAFSFDPDPLEDVTIYSDFEGWHVRLAPDGPPVVTGTVVGQVTPLVSTEPPGPGVQLIADPATGTVTFRLTAGTSPVGFDFSADCAQKSLTFDLKDDAGQPLDPADVHLGRKGGTTALPVVAQRTMAAG